MSDDFFNRLDQMANEAQRSKDDARAKHEALVAQRDAEDKVLNEKIQSIIKARLKEVKQKLNLHNVTIEDDSTAFVGRPATSSSFYLESSSGRYGLVTPRTSSYEFELSHSQGVRVTRKPKPARQHIGNTAKPEDITSKFGRITIDQLDKDFVDKVIEEAFKEYLDDNN